MLGNTQAQIRFATKLDLLAGLAKQGRGHERRRRASPPSRARWASSPPTRAWSTGLIYGAEHNCEIDGNGVAWPGRAESYASVTLQSQVYPRWSTWSASCAAAALIQLPSSVEDFRSEATREDLERYVQSPGHPPAGAGQAAQAGLGPPRLGVRRPAPAVRDVLRGRAVPGEGTHVPQLRLRPRRRRWSTRRSPGTTSTASSTRRTRPGSRARDRRRPAPVARGARRPRRCRRPPLVRPAHRGAAGARGLGHGGGLPGPCDGCGLHHRGPGGRR